MNSLLRDSVVLRSANFSQRGCGTLAQEPGGGSTWDLCNLLVMNLLHRGGSVQLPNLEAEERKVPQRQRESKSHIALSLAKSLIEMRHCIELERERERERESAQCQYRYPACYMEGISRKRTPGINKCIKWDLEILLRSECVRARSKMWPRQFWHSRSSPAASTSIAE